MRAMETFVAVVVVMALIALGVLLIHLVRTEDQCPSHN